MTTTANQAASLAEDEDPTGEPAPTVPTLEPAQCAVAHCAEIVSGKWTLLLLRDLALGERSYSDLERSLAGISPRTLCDRLRLLAAKGLVQRTRIKGLPPRSVYALTDRGAELIPVIETMRTVGEALLASPFDDAAAADIVQGVPCDKPCD